MNARKVLVAALLALAAVYAAWFAREPDRLVAWLVFALPPALFAAGVAAGRRTAGFWSGVFALAWFSHAVMVAWTRPADRGHAFAALGLSLAIVFAASVPGLRARFSRKH